MYPANKKTETLRASSTLDGIKSCGMQLCWHEYTSILWLKTHVIYIEFLWLSCIEKWRNLSTVVSAAWVCPSHLCNPGLHFIHGCSLWLPSCHPNCSHVMRGANLNFVDLPGESTSDLRQTWKSESGRRWLKDWDNGRLLSINFIYYFQGPGTMKLTNDIKHWVWSNCLFHIIHYSVSDI